MPLYDIFAAEVSWIFHLKCLTMRYRMLTGVCWLGLAALGCGGTDSSDGSIQGVWRVTERSFSRPDSSWTNSNPEAGLYMFGERYFSVQEIRESGPRALFSDGTTALERLAAFDVFHAHSTLNIVPTHAKSPNSMRVTTLTRVE